MGRFPTRAALAAALALTLVPEIAVAQSRPELIPVPGRIKMALYRPDSGPAPTVGIIVMHRTSNYLTHRACTELSRRGFLMLCMNSRFENNEPAVDFEQLPLDVKTRRRVPAQAARHQQGRAVRPQRRRADHGALPGGGRKGRRPTARARTS